MDWPDNKTLVHNRDLFILDLLCLGCVRSSIIELEVLETLLGTGQKQCSSNCRCISVVQCTFKLWIFDLL